MKIAPLHSRFHRVFLLGLLFSAALSLQAEDAARSAATKVGPAAGQLLIVGGGNMAKLWPDFFEMAGGKDVPIVVIPTADEVVNNPCPAVVSLRALGATHITQLHTKDRAVADSEDFTAPLRAAKAVWITGGRQWRLADSYLGTRTQRELFALLARGGTIGGSSAGASIQASYLVRGAPEGNKIMMSPGHEEGFAFLRNTAIDQHVNTRERATDIVPVLKAHPALLGIALDEATAIKVTGDRVYVIGVGKVRFFATPTSTPVELIAGGKYDLSARQVLP